MTVATHSSIQSFEIAPGPITTSVRKEPYEYNACPFTYSKEALRGRLEIWDSGGRLVYSWQRTCPSTSPQPRPPSIPLTTTSRATRSVSEVKPERDSHDVQLMAVRRVRREPSSIAPTITSQTARSDSHINAGRTPQNLAPGKRKRKKIDATEPDTRIERNKAAPRGLFIATQKPRTWLTYSK